MNLLIFILFVPFLALILLGLNILLSPHKSYEEKLSAFECGSPVISGQTRESFQVQFWLVCMLFLVFDIELVLLLPVGVSLYAIDTYGFYIAILFFIILTIGFIFEIGVGAISIKPAHANNKSFINNNNDVYLINPFFSYVVKFILINQSNYYKRMLHLLILNWNNYSYAIFPYYFLEYLYKEWIQDILILGLLSTGILLSTIFLCITKYPFFILYYSNIMALLFCIFLIITIFVLLIEVIVEMYNYFWSIIIGRDEIKRLKVIYYTFIYMCAYLLIIYLLFYIIYYIIIKWIFYLFIYV